MSLRVKHIIILTCLCLKLLGQEKDSTQKHRFPIWTFHTENTNIYGLSAGLWTTRENFRQVNTYGVKLELIGIGLAVLLIPESPVAKNEKEFLALKDDISEKVNGISLSPLGTVCDCKTNGVSLGVFGQINSQINGTSFGMFNFSQIHNGFQLAIWENDTYKMNGLQIGLFNISHQLKGLQIGLINESDEINGFQIGLWNKNEKRKMPLFNW